MRLASLRGASRWVSWILVGIAAVLSGIPTIPTREGIYLYLGHLALVIAAIFAAKFGH